jgi:hypothetical protein
MPNAVLTRLADERAGLVEFVDTTLAKANEAGRDLVDTELANLASTQERIAKIDSQMAPLEEFEKLRASAVQVDRLTSGTQTRSRQPAPVPVADSPGLADFANSDQFRSYGGGTSGRMIIDRAPAELRAPLVTGALPGQAYLPEPQRYAAPAAALTTPLLSAITRVPVSTGSVDIVRYSQAASGFAVVAEGTDKPEVIVTASVTPTPLETVAGWIELSRQLLSDGTAVQSMINSQLVRGLNKKLDDLVTTELTGAGANIPDVSGDDLLAAVRVGIATVQEAGFDPNVVLANPMDLADLDLTIFAGTAAGPSIGVSYWGVRPVPVSGLAAGTVYVADLASAMVLFERTGVEIYMTDSDVTGAGKSGFRANLVTILAECRAKSAVVNPDAMVQASAAVTP